MTLIKYWRELIIIGLCIVIAFMSKCSDGRETTETKTTIKDTTVVIPSQEGKFEKPTKAEELPSAGKDSVKINGKVVHTPNPIDQKIKKQLEKAKDSIDILNIAVKAAQERDYLNEFTNDSISVFVKSKVQGELKDMTVRWKIPEQKVVVQTVTVETTKTVEKKDQFGTLLSLDYDQQYLDGQKTVKPGAGIRIHKTSVIAKSNLKTWGVQLIQEF